MPIDFHQGKDFIFDYHIRNVKKCCYQDIDMNIWYEKSKIRGARKPCYLKNDDIDHCYDTYGLPSSEMMSTILLNELGMITAKSSLWNTQHHIMICDLYTLHIVLSNRGIKGVLATCTTTMHNII